MTDQQSHNNNGTPKEAGSVNSQQTGTTQTRFSFYNAQDFVQSTASEKLKTPRKETSFEITASRDSVEILRSLQEHEQQRHKILGAARLSAATAANNAQSSTTSAKDPWQRMDNLTATRASTSVGSEASNPYEDAIKEALDLLRKHRTKEIGLSLPDTSGLVAGNPVEIPSPTNTQRTQQQQPWTDPMVLARSKTPPEADRILQSRGSEPLCPENNTLDAAGGFDRSAPDPRQEASSSITPSAVALGEAYQAEIEARRKQRQERMARYANRLAELKQEDKYAPSNNDAAATTAQSDVGNSWRASHLDALPSWNNHGPTSQGAPQTSRSVPNGFPGQLSSPGMLGIMSQADTISCSISKDEEVQRGVERVLLAILDRANSQGRGGREKTDSLRYAQDHSASFPWAGGDEKKAITPVDSRGSIDSIDHGDNPLVRAMADLLAAPSTSTLGSSSPNRDAVLHGIIGRNQKQERPYANGMDRLEVASPPLTQLPLPGVPKPSRKPNLTVETSLSPSHDRDVSPEDDLDKMIRTVLIKDTLETTAKKDHPIDRRVRQVLSPDVEKQQLEQDCYEYADNGIGPDVESTERTQDNYEKEYVSNGSEDYEDTDNTNTHSELDGVLGPLSKNAGGTTGVVLEADSSSDSKDSIASPSLLDSISAAVSLVTGTLKTDNKKDKYSSNELDDESNELMLSLCAHLLPPSIVQSARLLEKRPNWDDSNPDEAGYRIIRLTTSQLMSIEHAFEKLKSEYKKKSAKTDNDDDFERDLQAAEEALDRHDRKTEQQKMAEAELAARLKIYPEQKPLECFPGVKSTGRGEMGDLEYFNLPIIFKSHVTGFEPTKDLVLESGNIVAGQYLVEGELGSAAFSTAYRCVDLNSEGDGPDGHDEVCLKVIKNTKDFFDQSLDEIKILELLRQTGMCHEKNLVEMRTFFYHREHLVIVTELLRQNLFEFGKFIVESDEEPYFTMPRLSYLTRQILVALDFVHKLGLVHSDIKPENILLSSYSRAQVKVIDFGSSCFLTDRQSSYIQSRSYRAPEVILGLPYDGRIDVWSLGCVVAEMFTGEVTFQNDSIVSMLSRIEAICGTFPSHMIAQGRQSGRFFTKCGLLYEKLPGEDQDSRSDESDDESSVSNDRRKKFVDVFQPKVTSLSARLGFAPDLMRRYDEGRKMSKEENRQAVFVDFVRQLLTIDPDKRPTAEEALSHPWMIYAEGLIEEEIKYPSF